MEYFPTKIFLRYASRRPFSLLLFHPILALNPIFVPACFASLEAPPPLFLFFPRFSVSRSSVAESSRRIIAPRVSHPLPPPLLDRGAQFLAPVDRATGGRPFGWQQTLPPPVTVADKMHPKCLSYFPPSPRSLALAKSLTPRLSARIAPRHWISRIPELFQTPFFSRGLKETERFPLLSPTSLLSNNREPPLAISTLSRSLQLSPFPPPSLCSPGNEMEMQ